MAKNLPFSYSRLYWSTSSCDDALMESVPGQRSDKLHIPVGESTYSSARLHLAEIPDKVGIGKKNEEEGEQSQLP